MAGFSCSSADWLRFFHDQRGEEGLGVMAVRSKKVTKLVRAKRPVKRLVGLGLPLGISAEEREKFLAAGAEIQRVAAEREGQARVLEAQAREADGVRLLARGLLRQRFSVGEIGAAVDAMAGEEDRWEDFVAGLRALAREDDGPAGTLKVGAAAEE